MIIARLFFESQRSGLVFSHVPMPFQILLFIATSKFRLHAGADSIVCASLEGDNSLREIIEPKTDVENYRNVSFACFNDCFYYWRGIEHG